MPILCFLFVLNLHCKTCFHFNIPLISYRFGEFVDPYLMCLASVLTSFTLVIVGKWCMIISICE